MLAGQSVTLSQPIVQPLPLFAKRWTRQACVRTHGRSVLARNDPPFAILLAVAAGDQQGRMDVAGGENALGENLSRIVDISSPVQMQVCRVFYEDVQVNHGAALLPKKSAHVRLVTGTLV